MSIVGADINLLFGILALQVDFIDRNELIDGMQAWSLDKSRSLGAILVERGALRPEQREPIEMIVRAHLQGSNNNPQQCLMALTSACDVPEELSKIEDGDIEHTLSHVSFADSRAALSDSSRRVQDKHFGHESSDSGRFERLELHEEGGLGTVWIADGSCRWLAALHEPRTSGWRAASIGTSHGHLQPWRHTVYVADK